jgi:hypothetical protein
MCDNGGNTKEGEKVEKDEKYLKIQIIPVTLSSVSEHHYPLVTTLIAKCLLHTSSASLHPSRVSITSQSMLCGT